MIQVHVFEFTKGDMASVPPDERALMFLSGHTLNQLGVWVKFLALTMNGPTANPQDDHRLETAQAQILLRALAGTLVEAYKWLNGTKGAGPLLRSKYLALVDEKSATAFAALNSSFGSGLSLAMRNKFTYHYPSTTSLSVAFGLLGEDFPLHWYVSDENTNSFYHGCESIVNAGMMNLAPGADLDERSVSALRLIVQTANHMAEFLGGLLAAVVEQHFQDQIPRSVHHIQGAPGPRTAMSFYFEDLMTPRD